ncbi:MAG: hypothetical protein LBN99_02900, partial [Oscillospiraceae bacterium]|nr:hypothetical protein [Oscillospiraceae bacterium]
MSIRQLTQSMDIVSALDDEPNDEGGLSSSDLKAKFDEGGNIIKSFINGMLIPDINERIQDEVNSVTLESGNMPTGGVSG